MKRKRGRTGEKRRVLRNEKKNEVDKIKMKQRFKK
jgi:hypothetical protein